jgi:hypothetical protein
MRLPFLCGALATIILASQGVALGETKIVEIDVDALYPMRAAIEEINKLSVAPINLEGVPILHSSDMIQLEGVTDSLRRSANIMIPITKRLVVPIAVDQVTGRLEDLAAAESALRAIVSAYNSADLPGEYELEQTNESFFVLPVKYRDSAGITQSMTPLLATLISLPAEKRTLDRTFKAILESFSQKTGFHILDLRPAMNGMENQVVFGATNEPAGHVLARFFSQKCMSGSCLIPSQTGDGLTWDTGLSFKLNFIPRPGWCGPFSMADQQPCYGVAVERNWNRPPYVSPKHNVLTPSEPPTNKPPQAGSPKTGTTIRPY